MHTAVELRARVAFVTIVSLSLFWFVGCRSGKTGTFAVLKGEKDGHPLFATIDSRFRDPRLRAGLPWFLGVSTVLKSPTSDGFTTNEEATELNDWEDSFEQAALNGCRFAYVGRVTWNGRRELLYYLDSTDCASPKIRSFTSDHPSRKFDFKFERDDRWEKVGEYFASWE